MSDKHLEYTGERIIPGHDNLLFQRHKAAYRFMEKYVKPDFEILETGCGEGYGSYSLANLAAKVTAIDVSEDAIQHARSKYKRENLEYRVMSATTLDFPDNSFNLACSFQVIEHLENYHKYLQEIKRVLAPGGTMFLTTPNKFTSPGGNIFHLKEFYPKELKDELTVCFPVTKLLGICREGLLGEEFIGNSLTTRLIKKIMPKFVKKNILKLISSYSGQSYKLREDINTSDFVISELNLKDSIDLLAICSKEQV